MKYLKQIIPTAIVLAMMFCEEPFSPQSERKGVETGKPTSGPMLSNPDSSDPYHFYYEPADSADPLFLYPYQYEEYGVQDPSWSELDDYLESIGAVIDKKEDIKPCPLRMLIGESWAGPRNGTDTEGNPYKMEYLGSSSQAVGFLPAMIRVSSDISRNFESFATIVAQAQNSSYVWASLFTNSYDPSLSYIWTVQGTHHAVEITDENETIHYFAHSWAEDTN